MNHRVALCKPLQFPVPLQIITMLFTGTAPLYLMSTAYVLVGALLGCPMGAEFKTALQAAWQVSGISCRHALKGMLTCKADTAWCWSKLP